MSIQPFSVGQIYNVTDGQLLSPSEAKTVDPELQIKIESEENGTYISDGRTEGEDVDDIIASLSKRFINSRLEKFEDSEGQFHVRITAKREGIIDGMFARIKYADRPKTPENASEDDKEETDEAKKI